MLHYSVLLYLIILLTNSFIESANKNCDCPDRHLQTVICEADYAMFMLVQDVQQKKNGVVKYKFDTISVDKVNSKAEKALKKGRYLYISKKSASCGLALQPGNKYGVTGYVENSKLWSSHCELIELTTEVFAREVEMVRCDFTPETCNSCKVIPCYKGLDCPSRPHSCNWVVTNATMTNFGLCSTKYSKNNECSWFISAVPVHN